jgi:aspartokinase-like uncharacterized kinase
MWVVKLGGSLLGSAELPRWLEVLARHGDGRVVIVPGGGVFADAVREAQARSGMSEAMAHRLAVLAMDQYGLLLSSLCPQLATAASELELAGRSWQHRAIVWLPSKMVLADESIPQSWEVTSDSLAAWLAGKLKARRLVLVKSAAAQDLDASAEELVRREILDGQFPRFVTERGFECWVTSKEALEDFSRALLEGSGPGTRID